MSSNTGKDRKKNRKSLKFWFLFVALPAVVVVCSSLLVYGLYVKNKFPGKQPFEKGSILANLGRHKEAIEEYNKALTKKPKDATIHYNMGISYFNLKEYDKAETKLREALKIKPEFTDAEVQIAVTKLTNALELKELGKNQSLVLEKLSEAEEVCIEILNKHANLIRAHMLLGEIHIEQGFYKNAIDDYKKALLVDNSLVDAHISLIKLFLHEGNIDLAEQQCKTALTVVEPDNYQIHMLLADIYDKDSNFDKAISTLKQVLEKKPDEIIARTHLSVLYLKTAELDKALSEAEKVFELSTPQTLPPIVYFVKGSVLLQKKDYINAISQLNEVVRRLPKMANGHYLLGRALMESDRNEQAMVEFNTTIKLAPEFVPAKLSLANLLIKDGKFKDAIDIGKDILYLEPENVNVMQMIGMAYIELGKLNSAEKQFNKIYKLNPSIGDINMAYLSLKSGKFSKCIKICKDIIKINPKNPKAYDILGIAHLKRGEYEEGIEQFIKVFEIDQSYTNAYLNLAIAYISAGKYPDAIKTLEKFISLTPGNVNAMNILANLYKNEGNIDRAVEIFEDVLAIKRDYLPAFALASLYLLKGDTKKALDMFNKTLKLSPENALIYNDFAVAYQQNNNFVASIEYAKKAIDLKPEISSFKIVMANLYTSISEIDKAMEQVSSVSELNDEEKKEYRALIELCQKDSEKGKKITLMLNMAIVAKQNGIFKMAIDECKKAMEIFPDNMVPKIFLAETYLSSGQNEKAIEIYNEIVKNRPAFALSYHGLGKAYLLSQKQNQAISIYKNLAEIDKESVSVRLTLASLLLKQGSTDEALKMISEATELDPENITAHSMFGKVNLKTSKYENAEKEFLKTLELDSGTFESYFNLAKLKLADGDIDKCIEHCKAGLKIRPADINLRNILGLAYARKGSMKMAALEFKKILDINAEFIPAYINLAKINLKTNQPAVAIHICKTALNIDPENIDVRSGLGNAYLATKKYQEAIEQFNLILKDDPENVNAYIYLASSYMTIGNYKKANEMIAKAIKLNPESKIARSVQAKIFIKEENIPGAINLLKSLIKDNPDFTDAYLLGVLYIDTGQYDKAISTYKLGLENLSENASLWSNLAIAYLMNEEYENAVDASTKAFNINSSGNVKSIKEICKLFGNKAYRNNDKFAIKIKEAYHLSRIIAYLDNNWFKRALSEYDKLIELLPSKRNTYIIKKVDILASTGEYDRAIEICKKLINVEPGLQNVYSKLASVYVLAGNMEDAEKQLRKATEIAPEDANAQTNLGVILQTNNKIAESIEAYKRAIELEPSAIAYNNLAWLYTYKHKDANALENAVMFAEKAKELSGRNASIMDTLGWAYYLSGMYDKALQELEEAVNDFPWNSTIRYHLGMTYYKKGMARLALHEMERAIELDAKFPEADEARVLINEITMTK